MGADGISTLDNVKSKKVCNGLLSLPLSFSISLVPTHRVGTREKVEHVFVLTSNSIGLTGFFVKSACWFGKRVFGRRKFRKDKNPVNPALFEFRDGA